jgi:hypothetical protein
MAEQLKKGPGKPAPRIDFELLSAEDKLRIQEEVLATARAERKLAAEEAYKKIALEEARREEGLAEEQVTFVLDLAEFADRLTIDGKIYFHARQYTVPRSVYQTMTEMAFRTHQHQHEIDGKSMTRWRGWDDPRIGAKAVGPHGVINTSQLVRQ